MKLDAERQRQQELLYAVDFQSQLMQRKVARVSGEGPSVDNSELQQKIVDLEKNLEEQKQLEKLLQQQVKRQQNDVRFAEKIVIQLEVDAKKIQGRKRWSSLSTRRKFRVGGWAGRPGCLRGARQWRRNIDIMVLHDDNPQTS